MSRPEDPVTGRALPPPADPWATIDRTAPAAHFGDPDATARAAPAAYYGDPDATVRAAPAAYFGEPDATARAAPAAREVRFGPGVPTPPVSAPGWPVAAPPARRPRPLWRRVVSVLSSLLTLALIAVLGFHLWQRLAPLEVESATVAVPLPSGTRCDVTVHVVATVQTNGRSGTIRYQWFRSDEPPGPVLTEQVARGERTAKLTLKWTFSGVGTTTETATVNIIEPSPLQARTPVTYRCGRG